MADMTPLSPAAADDWLPREAGCRPLAAAGSDRSATAADETGLGGVPLQNSAGTVAVVEPQLPTLT